MHLSPSLMQRRASEFFTSLLRLGASSCEGLRPAISKGNATTPLKDGIPNSSHSSHNVAFLHPVAGDHREADRAEQNGKCPKHQRSSCVSMRGAAPLSELVSTTATEMGMSASSNSRNNENATSSAQPQWRRQRSHTCDAALILPPPGARFTHVSDNTHLVENWRVDQKPRTTATYSHQGKRPWKTRKPSLSAVKSPSTTS